MLSISGTCLPIGYELAQLPLHLLQPATVVAHSEEETAWAGCEVTMQAINEHTAVLLEASTDSANQLASLQASLDIHADFSTDTIVLANLVCHC